MPQHHSLKTIKARVRIEDIVRQRGVALRATQGGERLEGRCPFHPGDETPSLSIYVVSQRYHCFGCGADGDVIDFVRAWDGCTFQEALHRLSGIILAPPTAQPAQSRTSQEVVPVPFSLQAETDHPWSSLLTVAQQSYYQTILAHPTLKEEIRKTRGITAEGIERCHVGYSDGSLLPTLLGTPETRHLAETSGLLSMTQQERLLRRLVIPEVIDGICPWMIGRAITHPSGKRHSKYLGLSLPKPLLGYGLALKRLQEQRVIRAILIVEGAIDYVIASQWDLPVVCVALIGTHASRRQFAMLLDLHQRAGTIPLLISLDADEAGRQASRRLLAHLRQSTPYVTELPPIVGAKDLGDLGILPDGFSCLQASLEQALSAASSQGGFV